MTFLRKKLWVIEEMPEGTLYQFVNISSHYLSFNLNPRQLSSFLRYLLLLQRVQSAPAGNRQTGGQAGSTFTITTYPCTSKRRACPPPRPICPYLVTDVGRELPGILTQLLFMVVLCSFL